MKTIIIISSSLISVSCASLDESIYKGKTYCGELMNNKALTQTEKEKQYSL